MAFPDIKAEYWLSLENEYRLYLLRNRSIEDQRNKEIVDKYRLNDVFKDLNYDDHRKVKELLDLAGVSNIDVLDQKVSKLENTRLMHDGGNKHTIFLWLKLCEEQVEIQNDLNTFPAFDNEQFKGKLDILKKLLNTTDYMLAFKNIKKFLNSMGVGLVIQEAIPTAKVRGATTLYGNHPIIYLSTRYRRIDSIYFALLREVYHIVEQDYLKDGYVLSYEDDEREILSNYNAKNFFIDEEKYNEFIKKGKFTEEEIIIFSKENGVVKDIVIGRLQFDGFIEYNQYQNLRTYIDKEGFYSVYFNIKK